MLPECWTELFSILDSGRDKKFRQQSRYRDWISVVESEWRNQLGNSGCLNDGFQITSFVEWLRATKILMSFRKFFGRKCPWVSGGFFHHLPLSGSASPTGLSTVQMAPNLCSFTFSWLLICRNEAAEESACFLKHLSYSKTYSLWKVMKKDKTNDFWNVGIMGTL